MEFTYNFLESAEKPVPQALPPLPGIDIKLDKTPVLTSKSNNSNLS